MEVYEMLREINRKEIMGEEIPEAEKEQVVSAFLHAVCGREEVINYKKRMRAKAETENLYPNYYIPPYSGSRKYRLVQGYLPKTNMLYANHYELEILRVLCRNAPKHKLVNEMVEHTLQRLKCAGFGNRCMQGEYAIVGICTLRLLAAVRPGDSEGICRLLDPLGNIFLSFGNGQAAVQKGIPVSYLLMAFTDINNEKTRTFLAQRKDWLLNLLRRGWIMGKLSNGKISEIDTYNLLFKYIIRNALGTLPEYVGIGTREIYVSSRDGRCYCNI